MKTLIFTLATGLILFSSCKSGSVKDPEYRSITNVRLISAGLLQSVAGIDIIYYNPNKFSAQLKDVSGDVYINDSFFGRFEVQEKVQMTKRSDFTVPAIVKLDMIGILKNQRDLFNNKDAKIRIEGFAKVQKTGISVLVPIKYEGMQNIERLRSLVSL
jgi:LEA14-like dessication related protein